MLRCREQREEAGSLSHGSLGQKKESMEGKVLSFDGWKCSRNNRKEQMNTLRWQKCTKQSDYRFGTTNAMLTTSTILKIINNGGIGQGLLFSKLDRCSNVILIITHHTV